MTYADLQRLQWAVRRVQFLKAHPEHPDAWKADVYKYDLIPDMMKEHFPAILKSLEKTIQPPDNQEFKL